MTDHARPLLVYLGPTEGHAVVREVAGAHFEIVSPPPEAEAVARALARAAAVLDASLKVRITRAMLDGAPHLRVIATATTGADHIDATALARRGIPLLTLRGQPVLNDLTPAAEHSWLLLLACARGLVGARAHALAGQWDRMQFPGLMLRGRALGIIGCGRIGQRMATYAQAFGMRRVGYDPYVAPWPADIERATLPDLLGVADAISVHVTLTDETKGLLDRRAFALIKLGAIVINTSRGEVIDEQALVEALQSGRVRAAGVDVLAGEPEILNSPLRRYALDHDNVIVTPHIGGYSPDAVRVVVRFSAQRILQQFGFAT